MGVDMRGFNCRNVALVVALVAVLGVAAGCELKGSDALIGKWIGVERAAGTSGVTTRDVEIVFFKDGTLTTTMTMVGTPGSTLRWEATSERDIPAFKVSVADGSYAGSSVTYSYVVSGNRLLIGSAGESVSQETAAYSLTRSPE